MIIQFFLIVKKTKPSTRLRIIDLFTHRFISLTKGSNGAWLARHQDQSLS